MLIGKAILSCLIGYILGNFSPSYLFARKKGYDVREDGSGNAGASNALILAGKKAFFLTAALDIMKAFLACRLCRALFPDLQVSEQLGGVCCVLGHMYPIALRFRGGKGLASLGGVVLSWRWDMFLFLLFVALAIAFLTQYLCFVAPAISVIFPGCYFFGTKMLLPTVVLLLPVIPVFYKHSENFRRVLDGTELRMRYLWDKDGELERIGRK